MEDTALVCTKYLLIDLDGTLINTANIREDILEHIQLTMMKKGELETDLSQIQIFEGATNFLTNAKSLGFECIIVSDSHPKYVNPIVEKYFRQYCNVALSLADKPNTSRTLKFLEQHNIDISSSICYVIGDS